MRFMFMVKSAHVWVSGTRSPRTDERRHPLPAL
jgi:hypothetical protein